MTIKAVIFDFGGVFTTSPVENFSVYEKAHGLPERFIGEVIKSRINDGAFSKYERGEINFAAFDTAFAQETRAAGHEISGAQFLEFLKLAPKQNMIDTLHAVKATGFKTGCITNNFPKGQGASAPLADDYNALFAQTTKLFDHIIESSKVGVRKPEPRIYEMMCEALDVAPKQCIFIDDLGVNLKPARAMGMTTIRAPFGDVTPAINELRRVIAI